MVSRRMWHRVTMRVPPPLASRAPGYTAPGFEPSPLCAARPVGLRVNSGAASALSERYEKLARPNGSEYRIGGYRRKYQPSR
jgi:hypothetical protein